MGRIEKMKRQLMEESTKDNKTKLVIENDSDLLNNLNKFLM